MNSLDRVYTLADLANWTHPGVSLAVLGQPIAHSLSPVMHNAALQKWAKQEPRFQGWEYYRFEINPQDLREALALFHEKKFRGLNLTIPHKIIAVPLVEQIDAASLPIAAVNTLQWTTTGWIGFNTDGYGLSQAVRQSLGLELTGQNILLLGAGGAARAAAVECLQRNCTSLTILNRSPEKIAELTSALAPVAGKIPLRTFAREDLHAAHLTNALVINATSIGLNPSDPSPLDLRLLSRSAGIFEMVYNPPVTALLRQAAQLKIPGANGLTMLVHQGAKALEIWSGLPAEATAPIMAAAVGATSTQVN